MKKFITILLFSLIGISVFAQECCEPSQTFVRNMFISVDNQPYSFTYTVNSEVVASESDFTGEYEWQINNEGDYFFEIIDANGDTCYHATNACLHYLPDDTCCFLYETAGVYTSNIDGIVTIVECSNTPLCEPVNCELFQCTIKRGENQTLGADVFFDGVNVSSEATYLWSTGETTEDITYIIPDCPNEEIYTVQITYNDCTCNPQEVIPCEQDPCIFLEFEEAVVNIIEDDAVFNVIPTNGTPPYTFQWNCINCTIPFTSTGQNPVIIDVTADNNGTYQIILTDSQGCQIIDSVTIDIDDVDPCEGFTAVVSSVYPGNVVASDLELGSTANGGTSPYNYSWSGPGGFVSGIQNPGIANAIPENSGTYTVTITDDNGCVATAATTVTIGESFDCPELSLNIGDDCDGGNGIVKDDCKCRQVCQYIVTNCDETTWISLVPKVPDNVSTGSGSDYCTVPPNTESIVWGSGNGTDFTEIDCAVKETAEGGLGENILDVYMSIFNQIPGVDAANVDISSNSDFFIFTYTGCFPIDWELESVCYDHAVTTCVDGIRTLPDGTALSYTDYDDGYANATNSWTQDLEFAYNLENGEIIEGTACFVDGVWEDVITGETINENLVGCEGFNPILPPTISPDDCPEYVWVENQGLTCIDCVPGNCVTTFTDENGNIISNQGIDCEVDIITINNSCTELPNEWILTRGNNTIDTGVSPFLPNSGAYAPGSYNLCSPGCGCTKIGITNCN